MSAKLGLCPLTLCCVLAASASAAGEGVGRQRMVDPGFDAIAVGELAGVASGPWELQRVGRPEIQGRLSIAGLAGEGHAGAGGRCVSLSIPKETVGFEFVTLGQRHRLSADCVYEASVWVRWVGGPEVAPAGASAVSGHPSAIVSFWVRHADGTGDFAGRDEWLFDSRWKRLSFRFRATDPARPSLLYVSLLPNQKPAATTVLIDDFELHETAVRAQAADEAREAAEAGSADGGFEKQAGPGISAPWAFHLIGGNSIRGNSIRGSVIADDGQKAVRIAMSRDTSNFESARLSQGVKLTAGQRYTVRCRMRWDSFRAGAPQPIVNFGVYHQPSNTWYGPIDQVLAPGGDWQSFQFTHQPVESGDAELYVQLNGWGNFGNALTVSFDDFSIERAEPRADNPRGAERGER